MASGSYNIDTFSWYRSLPLSNDTTPFSTLTMFAVGPSSFMKNYTFYDYTWANGFPDTSTFSVSITNYVHDSLVSTTSALGRTFISTIPYTIWRSGGNTYEYPVAGAVPEPYTYMSSASNLNSPYPIIIKTPNVWFGDGLARIINSRQYNVFVDSQYSIYLSTSFDAFTWVSTIGLFSNVYNQSYGAQNVGRVQTTRVGNFQYIDVHTKLMYMPDTTNTQIISQASSFYLQIMLLSTAKASGSIFGPSFDLYIPGENNITFTCIPCVSTVTVY
jgi:hypothetical protein